MSRQVTLEPAWKTENVHLLSVICSIVFIVSVCLVTTAEPEETGTQAAIQNTAAISEESDDSDCRRCHSCDRPTPENKCLLACSRETTRKAEFYPYGRLGPDVIILNELEKIYLPVPFDHRGHAEMAEMAEGCVTCHHHTPRGRPHPPCRTCHDILGAGTKIAKPGLKGAFHRQCLNCHREWMNERDCEICHRTKTRRLGSDDTPDSLTKDDALGRMHPLGQMHPPIPEPDTEIYRADSKQGEGSQVIFRHREHVRRFGLKCVECHHKENCTRCHIRAGEQKRPRVPGEHHRLCIQCHKRDMDEATTEITGECERCHWRQGQQKPEPFDHADTGWPLSEFHERSSCRDCHESVPFVELNSDCNACHGDWEPDSFDHLVTRQVLDENHAEQDCELCHIERRFDRPPTCDECHDEEDDGIAFPARRPGPVVAAPPKD